MESTKSYGCCIAPDGELTPVGQCRHTDIVPYEEADRWGWILTIDTSTPSSFAMSIRLNPLTATKDAIRKAILLIKDSRKKTFFIEDILTNNIFEDGHQGFSKQEAINRLRKISLNRKESKDGDEL